MKLWMCRNVVEPSTYVLFVGSVPVLKRGRWRATRGGRKVDWFCSGLVHGLTNIRLAAGGGPIQLLWPINVTVLSPGEQNGRKTCRDDGQDGSVERPHAGPGWP